MNIANLVTLLRLLLAPVVIWLLLEGQSGAAFALFLFAGITDAIDGMIAKRFGQVTELGAYLDPVADKVLLVSIFVTLGVLQELPAWLVLLAVSRDALIVGGVLLSYTLGTSLVMHPLLISKANTVAQIGLVAAVLAQMAFAEQSDTMVEQAINYAVWFTAATTAASGGAYIFTWVRTMNANAGTPDA
ncbi:MAG: CDP-alcohol phosphatidyltransferase family protein [Alphaproteobacteria bacterium]